MSENPRWLFVLGFVFCLSLLLIAGYFQFVEGLEPCPLCITQRLIVLVLGIVFLAATWQNPGPVGQRFYAALASLISIAGIAVAGRHVWLQHLPSDEVPDCGPGFSYMLKHFPIGDTLTAMLSGTGDCADVVWTLLGLSIPAWTVVAFVFLLGLSLFQLIKARPGPGPDAS